MRKLLAVLAFLLVVAAAPISWGEALTEQEKNTEIAKRTEIRLLIEDLGNYRDAQVKAMEKLVAIGTDAVPVLLRYISKSNETIRGNICIVLGQIGDSAAIPAIGALFADKSAYVHYMAQEGMRLLAHANGDAAIADVVDFLRGKIKDPNDSIRALSVEVLIDLNPVDFWEDIVVLLGDKYWKVRADAVKALGGISPIITVEQHAVICNAFLPLFSDSSWEVKRSVAIASGFFIALSTMYILPVEDADGNFTGFKQSDNYNVLVALVAKVQSLLTDENAQVRSSAAYALGNFWTEKAKESAEPVISGIITLLDDKDEEVRMAAASSLGRIGDKNAVGALVAHLEEKVPLVLNIIIEALRNRTLMNFGYMPYDILDESAENPLDTIEKYDAAMKELEEKRAEAIEKWKAWFEENKDTFEINIVIR